MPADEHRFDPQRVGRLINPERLARWQPARFLSRFGLPAGSRILELGCGPGFWSLALAEIAGQAGQVLACDASREWLSMLADTHPPAWVFPIRCKLPGLPLAADWADFIWAAFVIHEVPDLPALAGEMRRVMKPGGRVAILEWRPNPASQEGPPLAPRLSTQQVQQMLRGAGFSSIRTSWQDPDTYLIEAVKK